MTATVSLKQSLSAYQFKGKASGEVRIQDVCQVIAEGL